MPEVAIQKVCTEATINADAYEEPCRLGPYRVSAELVVQARTPEEAVRVVAERLRGEDSEDG